VKNFKQTVVKALLPHIMLQIVNEHPIHGYAIITLVRRRHGVYFGPSTVYPLLNALEKEGCVRSEWDLGGERPRKVYAITGRGRQLLGETANVLAFVNRAVEVTHP
jgi:DNA-binding PadR family transcriptional regulator